MLPRVTGWGEERDDQVCGGLRIQEALKLLHIGKFQKDVGYY